ncbi:MAG: rhodanese-like domain-containing protein [Gammaproteobacteria bacterium]
MVFRQLFDPESSTYTYILGDSESKQAVLIDGVFEQVRRDIALLSELGLELVNVVDTHCHADHVTSAYVLKQHTGAKIGVSSDSGVEGADVYLEHGDKVAFGGRYLSVRKTPGHTNGCVTFVLDDESMAFTGDTLLVRGCGRTDFQQGDARQMFRSIHSQILALPDTTKLYPAHDYKGITVTSVAEEKQFNPRFGGALSEDDFVGYMDHLGLPHPKQIDIAVPANLRCGQPEKSINATESPRWGPLQYTFAGIEEIDSQWCEEHLDDVQMVDVRESDEFSGPLGHIPKAIHIPLGELADRVAELDADKPIVTVCRAGGRSAQAMVILKRAGIEKIANLRGGMLRWRSEGHRVIGGVN